MAIWSSIKEFGLKIKYDSMGFIASKDFARDGSITLFAALKAKR